MLVRIRKTVRRLGLAAMTVVALALAAAFVYRGRLVELLKPAFERALSDATGYQVSFKSASFKVVPFLGLRLEDGEATSPAGCSPWRLKRAAIRIAILPLLERRIEASKIELEGLEGTLKVEDGAVFRVQTTGERCESPLSAQPSGESRAAPSEKIPVAVSLDALSLASSTLTVFGAQETHQLSVESLATSLQSENRLVSLTELVLTGSYDSFPFSLRARDGQFDSAARSFSLSQGEIGLGKQSLIVSGRYDLGARSGSGSIRADQVSLEDDDRIFVGGAPVVRGNVSLSLDLAASGETVTISGDVRLAEASLALGSPMSAKAATLSGIRATFVDGAFTNGSAGISLVGFACKDSADNYSVASVSGSLAATGSSALSVQGQLEASDFRFSDEDTSIQKVSAKLRDISAQLSPNGDATVRLALHASSIHLKNPNIEIFSVSSVTAPLKVTVPAAGGYSVVGPVTISGGRLSLLGKSLTETGGTVEMSVAAGLKTFQSRNLATVSLTEPLAASTLFAMTAHEYKASDTSFSLAGGSVQAGLQLGRHKKGPFSATLNARGVSLPRAYRALTQQESSPVQGTATEISMSVNADSADLLGTAKGTGAVRLANAVFTTIDLQSLVQGAISAVPVIGKDITPPKQPGPPPVSDGGLSTTAMIGDRAVLLPDLRVQFSNATVEGRLKAGFDSSLSGNVSLVLLEDTFRMLGFGIKPLGNFLAREGRVAIPLRVAGSLTDPSLSPDMEAVGRFATGQDLVDSIREAAGDNATPSTGGQ